MRNIKLNKKGKIVVMVVLVLLLIGIIGIAFGSSYEVNGNTYSQKEIESMLRTQDDVWQNGEYYYKAPAKAMKLDRDDGDYYMLYNNDGDMYVSNRNLRDGENYIIEVRKLNGEVQDVQEGDFIFDKEQENLFDEYKQDDEKRGRWILAEAIRSGEFR